MKHQTGFPIQAYSASGEIYSFSAYDLCTFTPHYLLRTEKVVCYVEKFQSVPMCEHVLQCVCKGYEASNGSIEFISA